MSVRANGLCDAPLKGQSMLECVTFEIRTLIARLDARKEVFLSIAKLCADGFCDSEREVLDYIFAVPTGVRATFEPSVALLLISSCVTIALLFGLFRGPAESFSLIIVITLTHAYKQ